MTIVARALFSVLQLLIFNEHYEDPASGSVSLLSDLTSRHLTTRTLLYLKLSKLAAQVLQFNTNDTIIALICENLHKEDKSQL